MALGGGVFTDQNEVMPGSYINIVSASRAVTDAERGVVTMPLIMDWGQPGKVVKITEDDFTKNSLKLFGYPHTHDKLKGIRDIFKNSRILYAYRIDNGGGKGTV